MVPIIFINFFSKFWHWQWLFLKIWTYKIGVNVEVCTMFSLLSYLLPNRVVQGLTAAYCKSKWNIYIQISSSMFSPKSSLNKSSKISEVKVVIFQFQPWKTLGIEVPTVLTYKLNCQKWKSLFFLHCLTITCTWYDLVVKKLWKSVLKLLI